MCVGVAGWVRIGIEVWVRALELRRVCVNRMCARWNGSVCGLEWRRVLQNESCTCVGILAYVQAFVSALGFKSLCAHEYMTCMSVEMDIRQQA